MRGDAAARRAARGELADPVGLRRAARRDRRPRWRIEAEVAPAISALLPVPDGALRLDARVRTRCAYRRACSNGKATLDQVLRRARRPLGRAASTPRRLADAARQLFNVWSARGAWTRCSNHWRTARLARTARVARRGVMSVCAHRDELAEALWRKCAASGAVARQRAGYLPSLVAAVDWAQGEEYRLSAAITASRTRAAVDVSSSAGQRMQSPAAVGLQRARASLAGRRGGEGRADARHRVAGGGRRARGGVARARCLEWRRAAPGAGGEAPRDRRAARCSSRSMDAHELHERGAQRRFSTYDYWSCAAL